MELKEFYKNKVVLVTGHTGFKGGWLVAWLNILGARVIGFSLHQKAFSTSLFDNEEWEKKSLSCRGDIGNFFQIFEIIKLHSPEIVFHCAAQSLVRRSYLEPLKTYTTNILGTAHVLEAIHQTKSTKVLVNVTTDKCYHNREWIWGYREQDELGGYDPYSSSKSCVELITTAYRNSFFKNEDQVAVATARTGNVIGGGDWAEDRLLPDMMRAQSSGTPLFIRNPHAIRPWQHVLEPLRGYLLLAQQLWFKKKNFSEAWNFAPRPEDRLSVHEIAKRVIRLWGSGEIIIQEQKDDFHESQILMLDASKARDILCWTPFLNIDESLKMTVDWYKAYLQHRSTSFELTTAQIQHYTDKYL